MRRWPIITEFNEERRLIGGVLSVRQMVYIIFSFSVSGGLVLFFWDISLILGLILAIPFVFIGILLGFYEKDGRKFDTWLREEVEYYFSQKIYTTED